MSKCHAATINRKKYKRKSNNGRYYYWQQHGEGNDKNNKNNKNKKIEYDDLIGQGAHGCVYKPPLKCKYQSYLDVIHSNDIMKLMKENANSLMEDEISRFLQKMDPSNSYYIPLSNEKCIVDDIKNKKELYECNAYYNSVNKSDFRGIFLKYGGPTFGTYLKNKNLDCLMVWRIVMHLLQGLNNLHSHKIIYMDVKEANIVVYDNVPRYIDFGLSKFIDALNYDDASELFLYPLYPLFYSVINAKNIKELYEIYGEPIKSHMIKRGMKFVKNGKTDYVKNYFDEYKKGKINYWNNIILKNIYKVDTYMLFNMFLRLDLANKCDVKTKEDYTLAEYLNNLIDYCIDPNVDTQYDMQKIYNFINTKVIPTLQRIK